MNGKTLSIGCLALLLVCGMANADAGTWDLNSSMDGLPTASGGTDVTNGIFSYGYGPTATEFALLDSYTTQYNPGLFYAASQTMTWPHIWRNNTGVDDTALHVPAGWHSIHAGTDTYAKIRWDAPDTISASDELVIDIEIHPSLNDRSFKLIVNGSTLLLDQIIAGNTVFTDTISAAGVETIDLVNINGGNTGVSFTVEAVPVPEPTTLGLLAAGALAFLRRKRA